ncbi:SulP family inorganic anion transporter [Aquimarina sp. W85]|uniref:SulP family inorganic anion transporter n=1 Tax=Aquimarina rhodophyticola TaxID=3342246 RepID=UPI00366CED65
MAYFKNNAVNFLSSLPKNIFSGFVVSLIALPLGLGLALASGAPPISGIIAAIVGGTIVAVLGGSHVTISGPGNGLVVVLLGAISTLASGDLYHGYLFTLAAIICSGVLMLLIGFLRLGILSDFFPSSAIQGMLAAIGISILAKQLHVMFGNIGAQGSTIDLLITFPTTVFALFSQASSSTIAAAFIGFFSLLIMRFHGTIRNQYLKLIPAPMWIVVLVIGYSYYYEYFSSEAYPIATPLLVQLPKGILSSFPVPDFSILFTSQFIGVVLAITLISSIESLLSIKAIDQLDPERRRSNVNRDLKALGTASIISGLLGGLNVVTVIARSSVNVNNGGSNRSANFFHALFLLLFVVLFQNQLRRIPLTALAAILVYTGYKLASPSTLKNIAKIGKEQVFIFIITIIATVTTSLITGILIGILSTLVIHVILNKSIFLFLSNVIRPNVLMYKEQQQGNYFISVKNFASFLNYYKLKDKLDVIPETSEVIVDFSLCEFVDFTVQEHLLGYQEIFLRNGGSFEINGLDIHGASSAHPLAMRRLFSFSARNNAHNHLTKRQKDLEQIACDFEWSYNPTKLYGVASLYTFVFFKLKKINFIHNQLVDDNQIFKVFDIEYTEGEFISQKQLRGTFLKINLEHTIPCFTLHKDDLFSFLYRFSGFKNITIKKHPDFSKRFFIMAEDKIEVEAFFNKALILFFESNPYYHIESNGSSLLVLKTERLASVKEVKALLDFGIRLQKIVSLSKIDANLLKTM